MIVPKYVTNLYRETLSLIEETGKRVKDIIYNFCTKQEKKYLFDERLKTPESVSEKIESGRFISWLEIDDLYACTVVIPLLNDEGGVIEFLKDRFICHKLIRRGKVKKQPDRFRFDSTRFIGSLKPPDGFSLEISPNIYMIKFEVQIKTVFDYAWSNATHALLYKADEINWSRARLAAQLKAASEQLDMLILGFNEATKYIGKGNWPSIEDKVKILKFFTEKIENGTIPSELQPDNWTRFTDNIYRLFQALEGLEPSGESDVKLKKLNDRLNTLNINVKRMGSEKIPRSISLFQFVLGELCSLTKCEKKFNEYYIPITDELTSLYPGIQFPGMPFS